MLTASSGAKIVSAFFKHAEITVTLHLMNRFHLILNVENSNENATKELS